MLRAAGYIRVSTVDQVEFSPEAQKKAIQKYARSNDIVIKEENIYIDNGISGRKADKRPAFLAMIKDAKSKPKPFDIILVHKFDRFARNREDSVVYKSLLRRECGIRVVSVTEQMEDDKFSIILESMLEAMAEYYSINLADEVKKGMKEKAIRGGIQQKPPYGYDIIDNQAIINSEEGKVVETIFDRFVHWRWKYGEIASYLNSLGYTTKDRNLFRANNIKYIVENSFYCGTIVWNRTNKNGSIKAEDEWIIKKGNYEPLVTEELYEEAQKIISENKKTLKRNARPSNTIKHYLSGLLKCKNCNGSLVYRSFKAGRYEYYRCRKASEGLCKHKKMIPLKDIENAIKNKLLDDLKDISGNIDVPKVQYEKDIKLTRYRLDRIRRKLVQAKKAYLEEIDSIDEYRINKARIQQEENELISKLNKYQRKEKEMDNKSNLVTDSITIIALLEDNKLSMSTKNKILKMFIKLIVVDINNSEIDISYYV